MKTKKIKGDKRFAQWFSYAHLLEIAKRWNPHPTVFPPYVIHKNLMFGWGPIPRPTRQKIGNGHPEFKIGSWYYQMLPLRGLDSR